MAQETPQCQNCKNPFTIEPDDFTFYEKIKVPPPTWCPECRAQRRFAFRNQHFLYKVRSAYSGKEIFSMFPPEAGLKIFEEAVWFGDFWDPLSYGREIDFSRPFLEQILELKKDVPHFNRSVLNDVGSEYCNNFTGFKNCYLAFNGNDSEDCMYGNAINNSKNCIDISHIAKLENSYEVFWADSCFGLFFSSRCQNSYNIFFSANCVNCSDCFGCVNLRNKKYHIFNKPYSREEYVQRLKLYDFGSHSFLEKIKKDIGKIWSQFPIKFYEGIQNQDVSGNYIFHAKNVRNSFLIRNAEDIRYCHYLERGPVKDSYDYTLFAGPSERIYESVVSGAEISDVRFSGEVFHNAYHIEYSWYSGMGSSNLFGCVGLRNKQYCILNKQYTKEEYESLTPRIIEHMNTMPYVDKKGRRYAYGEFFPVEFSPFPYNQTIAQEHFPLSKDDAIHERYVWRDFVDKNYVITASWKNLPDHIREVRDSVTDEVILCQDYDENKERAFVHGCTKGFRITKKELEFYKRYNIALPRKCFLSRLHYRLGQRTSVRSSKRACGCRGMASSDYIYKNTAMHFHGEISCPNSFQTNYTPSLASIVYCEQCYQQEVV